MDSKRHSERDGERGWGMCFLVMKPVRPDQLMAEVAQRLGIKTVSGVVTEGDLSKASPATPVTMWIDHRDSQVPSTVNAAVTAHVPAAAPLPAASRADLTEKARLGIDFTPEEIQIALRLLYGGINTVR